MRCAKFLKHVFKQFYGAHSKQHSLRLKNADNLHKTWKAEIRSCEKNVDDIKTLHKSHGFIIIHFFSIIHCIDSRRRLSGPRCLRFPVQQSLIIRKKAVDVHFTRIHAIFKKRNMHSKYFPWVVDCPLST